MEDQRHAGDAPVFSLADCIYVAAPDRRARRPGVAGERFGFVYEINYLRT